MKKTKVYAQKISKEAHDAILDEQASHRKETGDKVSQEMIASEAIINGLKKGAK